MTVVKRYPLQDILYLQERMNRAFDESVMGRRCVGKAVEWVPYVDIYEDSTSITIMAELPGMAREDIMLDISGETLTISGKKNNCSETRAQNYHMIERQYGSFRRSFTVPESVDPAMIDAKLEGGVLKIVLGKATSAQTRSIPISRD